MATSEKPGVVVRAFVDGPPTHEMLEAKGIALAMLDPTSPGRWHQGYEGRIELARACYEAGYDEAAIKSRGVAESKEQQKGGE